LLNKIGFTEAQLKTFQLISQPYRFLGTPAPPDKMYPGYPINSVAGWSGFLTGTIPPPWSNTVFDPRIPGAHTIMETMMRAKYGPDFDYVKSFNFDDEREVLSFSEPENADPFDLDAFKKGGGKFLVWHGVGDQTHTYLENVKGFEELSKRASLKPIDDWARLFLVPGLYHCGGGPGPDDVPDQALNALIPWVEKGKAPQSFVAHHLNPETGPVRSFLICASPMRAYLAKPGSNPNNAANWACQPPRESITPN
jgi:hypothetical protein